MGEVGDCLDCTRELDILPELAPVREAYRGVVVFELYI